MTYRQTVLALREVGIEDAETEAAILFEHYTSIPPHSLPYRADEDAGSVALMDALRRRLAREPLQYILGKWTFCGLTFALNSDCLCPRPDTELIVELAIKHLPKNATFCDIGTGSGAIAVSVLSMRPDTKAYAVDISPEALSAATENAKANGVGERFVPILADILAKDTPSELSSLDAIISNPPYIPSSEISSLSPEVRQEPLRALDGGEDGLVFYREITHKAEHIIKNDGFILYELGIGEHIAVSHLAAKLGYRGEIYKDLSGVERAILLRR
jgi:release factor glutamine methyltransferase